MANKIDLSPSGAVTSVAGGDPGLGDHGRGTRCACVSRSSKLPRGAAPREDPVLTDARQAAALDRAVGALERAPEALPLGDEIVLEDLRAALSALGEITGEIANDDLYDRIFSTFCIGK